MWAFEPRGNNIAVIARRSTGDEALICTLHADALPDERDLICGAAENLAFFLGLLDRASSAVRDLRKQVEAQQAAAVRKKYAAQAAMLLSDRTFQRFLEIKGAGGAVRDKTQADTRLKSILAVSSKKEIDNDPRAQAAFLHFRKDFEAWKRGGSR
ncbi:hypothetical protein N7379_19975 [Rhizobium pusense]|uniref:hypothetical protein n=1 Tax=Agrobacterium pusense TaxID=648995 RepID=UPI0024491917|nr:hypothetical protein [Agrobacterium pusense]MDH0116772.1 hypothetical protein [Agrobacterium pusense]